MGKKQAVREVHGGVTAIKIYHSKLEHKTFSKCPSGLILTAYSSSISIIL